MKFDHLVKELRTAGAETRETVLTAGFYYDGTQHGIMYPAVIARLDPYLIGWQETDDRKRRIADALKRYRTLHTAQPIGSAYIAYVITTKADQERAQAADAEAAVFLEAFNRHRHEALTDSADDPAGAVEAGKAAVKAWREIDHHVYCNMP